MGKEALREAGLGLDLACQRAVWPSKQVMTSPT